MGYGPKQATAGERALEDLTRLLNDSEIETLRAKYNPEQLRAANARAFEQIYPPLAPWAQAAASTFFRNGPLRPRERELCLITLLAHRAPGVSLANHVYWALMEGVTIAEICEAIGLAGCYGGLPTYTNGVLVLQRTLHILRHLAADTAHDSQAVLAKLVQELAGTTL